MKRLYGYVIFWFALSLFTYADGPDEIGSENVSEEMVSGNVSVQTDSEDVPTETVSEDALEKAVSEATKKTNCAGESEKELPRMNSEDIKKMDEEFDLARKSAEKIWMSYKEDVFTSKYNFNAFLKIVYNQGYKDFECLEEPLVAFKYFLLKSFLVEAQKRYNLLAANDLRRQSIAMESFLLCFAARCHSYQIFDKFVNKNRELYKLVIKRLQESYLLKPSDNEDKYRKNWKNSQWKVNWEIAIQLCRCGVYLEKNVELISKDYWNFLRLNEIIKGYQKNGKI